MNTEQKKVVLDKLCDFINTNTKNLLDEINKLYPNMPDSDKNDIIKNSNQILDTIRTKVNGIVTIKL